ncbi:MAG: helix-turn-helix domain-containing protein [Chloroflexi bacterium]|nr:helix-turn-helix domain-containing protein [Chloroflexota bacterium]
MYDMTAREASDYLEVSKRQITRLISRGVLEAAIEAVPVPYYLIDTGSIEAYKTAPKNKGGRPRKDRDE